MPPKTTPTLQLSADEIRLRGTLLGSNKELLQLHRTLVRGGLISEEEFWETRQGLLRSQETLLKQKKPPSSLLEADLGSLKDYHNEHKIILTPETIQSLLTQSPALYKAYKENVPVKLSEKEFWTFYVKSHFFKERQGKSSTSEDTNNPLNSYYEEAKFNQDNNMVTTGEGLQFSRLVDLTCTVEDHFSDYGNKTLQHLRSLEGEESLSLIKKFNQHSLKIVNSTVGNRPPIRIDDSIEIEDLSSKVESKVMPLEVAFKLQNPSSSSSFTIKYDCKTKVLKDEEFIKSIQSMKMDVFSFIRGTLETHDRRRSLMQPFMTIVEQPSQSEKFNKTAFSGTDVEIFHRNAAEVLRHFWSSFPPGKDTEKQAKVSRMTTILEQLCLKGRGLVASKNNIQEQVKVESALSAILEAMEYALSTRQKSIKVEESHNSSKRIKLDN